MMFQTLGISKNPGDHKVNGDDNETGLYADNNPFEIDDQRADLPYVFRIISKLKEHCTGKHGRGEKRHAAGKSLNTRECIVWSLQSQ